MHRTVVELDPLPDADGAGAKHNHLFPMRDSDLVLRPTKRGVIVRRHRLKLGGTGVHHLVARKNVVRAAHRTDLIACLLRQLGNGDIGKPDPFRRCKQLRCERSRGKLILHIRDMLELVDKPFVHLRDVRDGIDRQLPTPQGFGNDKDTLVIDERKLLFHTLIVPLGKAVDVETVDPNLK